jgi:hypothetical protein
VLRRHHLAAAFRLPSMRPNGREAIFPGAMLVTDLLFFRARGGELSEVDAADRGILTGHYFTEFPGHILGREVGRDAGEDDQTKAPRWGYQVMGEFTRLPDLVERPVCSDCRSSPSQPGECPRAGTAPGSGSPGRPTPRSPHLSRAGRRRHPGPPRGPLPRPGRRRDPRRAVRCSGPSCSRLCPPGARPTATPTGHVELVKLARGGSTGAERFLSAFDRAGGLIEGLRHAPARPEPRYAGRVEDVRAQAELLYRTNRALSVAELLAFHRSIGGRFEVGRLCPSCSTPAGSWTATSGTSSCRARST